MAEQPHSHAEDERRWAEALSVLAGMPTPSAEQRLRRWRTAVIGLIVGTGLVGVAFGLLLAATAGDGTARSTDLPTWRSALAIVCMSVGILGMLAGGVLAWRSGAFRWGFRQPLAVLTRAQRRQLGAQLRGRVPVDPRRLPLLRHLAGRLVAQGTMVWFWSAAVIFRIGTSFTARTRVDTWFDVGLLPLYAGVLGLSALQAWRGRRFLDEHPEPAAAEG